LSGGSRKSERLLVPDLATEWFRKQKVFLDKLSPEELAALSDGLADKDSRWIGRCRSPAAGLGIAAWLVPVQDHMAPFPLPWDEGKDDNWLG